MQLAIRRGGARDDSGPGWQGRRASERSEPAEQAREREQARSWARAGKVGERARQARQWSKRGSQQGEKENADKMEPEPRSVTRSTTLTGTGTARAPLSVARALRSRRKSPHGADGTSALKTSGDDSKSAPPTFGRGGLASESKNALGPTAMILY